MTWASVGVGEAKTPTAASLKTAASPEPSFVGALTGTQYIRQFSVNVPPYTVSPSHPDGNVDWSRCMPINGSGSAWYRLNHNPRNRKTYFNTAAFTPNALGTQGNSKRRMFYGPGLDNYDMALHKVTSFHEKWSLELRLEMFNIVNHAQFYPNGSVNGNVNDTQNFGKVEKAADPRIGQAAVKFNF